MIKSEPLVTIIVPVYNGEKFIDGFMGSLKKQSVKNWQVIFVDDCSTDNSMFHIMRYYEKDKIRLLNNKVNQGYADCVNKAYKLVNSKYFMCINIDVTFGKNFLKDLIRYIEVDNGFNIGMVCPLAYKDKKKDLAFFNDIFYKKKQSISLTTTGNIGFIDAKYHPKTKDLVETFYHGVFLCRTNQVGWVCGKDNLFDEDYHIYCEDMFLCWKLKANGYKIYIAPKVNYWHFCGSSRLDADINRKATFHGTKNKVMTLMIFHQYMDLLRLLPLIFVSELIYLMYDLRKIHIKLKAYLWILCNLMKIHRKHMAVNRDVTSDVLQDMNFKIYEPLRGGRVIRFILSIVNRLSYIYLKVVFMGLK